MNLFGHKYFGPGNPMNRGDPVDKDDKIAKQHDLEYDKAANVCEVREADKKAIALFGLDSRINRNWHSLIGVFGLGFKYVCETFTGVVYPPDKDKDCTCKEVNLEDATKSKP